ncbi:MAG: hypothetical protein NW223_12385 [Hyphomicrobiaceae bacterium]|nr:hypothetical protein [Hyphomicrobiaceae bacterium]
MHGIENALGAGIEQTKIMVMAGSLMTAGDDRDAEVADDDGADVG